MLRDNELFLMEFVHSFNAAQINDANQSSLINQSFQSMEFLRCVFLIRCMYLFITFIGILKHIYILSTRHRNKSFIANVVLRMLLINNTKHIQMT
jgi:hypothetical protein